MSRRQSRRVVHSDLNNTMMEPLEARQLLSAGAVLDLRMPDGSTTATVSGPGDVVNAEIWVTVTGNDADNTNDGLRTVGGSIASINNVGGSALGNINTSILPPFNANGSDTGAQSDLDGDGDLDVGSLNPASAVGFYNVRSASMETNGTTHLSNGQAFKIGTVAFTVARLLDGISTDMRFFLRGKDDFIYQVDGTTFASGQANTNFTVGTGITIKRPGAGSISGRVYNDLNANGIFDGTDTGISGFRVFLDEDADGQLDANEISKPVSTTGTYTFSNVPTGIYRVREVFRDGWRQTFPALGYYEVPLGYGKVVKSESFANTDTVLIKGNVFMDANVNHKKDPAEAGLSGWMLYIDHNNDGILNKGDDWALSDSKGNYRFFNLPAGTYVVRIVQQTGYRQTAPAGGSHTITLGAGGTVSNKNFGEKRLK